MNKGWIVVTLAIIGGILVGVFSTSPTTQNIRFDDIETECRVDDTQTSYVSLQQDNSLLFEGNYPVDNIETDISTAYTQTDNLIRLKVSNTEVEEDETFEHTCLGSVVYEGTTGSIQPGTYMLEVHHNDQQVRKEVIEIE